MTRPIENEYVSYVAYTRALEEYCDFLESENGSLESKNFEEEFDK